MIEHFKVMDDLDREEKVMRNIFPIFFLSESHMAYLENMYKSWSFTVNKYYTIPEWMGVTSNG